jgi:microcystin-dependent protein
MAELVYRLLQGEGVELVEDAATKTVTIRVPGLATKLNIGDIGQATQLVPGIAEIATNDEVRAGTDPDRIVTPAGLAAAAQSSLSDATASRLMRVGAFGIGGSALLLTSENLNAERPSGLYYCVTCTNGPISSAAAGNGWLLHRDHATAGYASQLFESGVTDRMFFRRQVGGTWSTWRELYHTANFDPSSKANTSGNYPGLVVGNSSQVGGQTDAMLAPPGMVAVFARDTAPAGWLVANGAAVSRTTYAALFAAIGTRWGAGNGSSTFNLPDLRGLFFRAWDAGRGQDPGRAFGSTQASANLSHSHTASTGGAGSHSHTGNTSTAPDHQHQEDVYGVVGGGGRFVSAINTADNSQDGVKYTAPAGAHSHTVTTNTVANHTHTVSIDAAGATESRPINVALLACIKF